MHFRQKIGKDLKKKLKENYYDNRLNGGKKNESK